MQLNEKTSLKKHIAMRFLSAPEGIRRAAPQQRPTGALLPRGTQSAGHGLFKSPILLPHKIRAKQKEQHPIGQCYLGQRRIMQIVEKSGIIYVWINN